MSADNHIAGTWDLPALGRVWTFGRADKPVRTAMAQWLYGQAADAARSEPTPEARKESLSIALADYAAGKFAWRGAVWAAALSNGVGVIQLVHLLLKKHQPLGAGETEDDRLETVQEIIAEDAGNLSADPETGEPTTPLRMLLKDVLDARPNSRPPGSPGAAAKG